MLFILTALTRIKERSISSRVSKRNTFAWKFLEKIKKFFFDYFEIAFVNLRWRELNNEEFLDINFQLVWNETLHLDTQNLKRGKLKSKYNQIVASSSSLLSLFLRCLFGAKIAEIQLKIDILFKFSAAILCLSSTQSLAPNFQL